MLVPTVNQWTTSKQTNKHITTNNNQTTSPSTVAPMYCTKAACQLTCRVVVDIVVALAAIDAQENLVVVVLVPVEGGDPGEGALGVAAHQVGHGGHHLPEGRAVLEEGGHGPEELPGAVPLMQLWVRVRG